MPTDNQIVYFDFIQWEQTSPISLSKTAGGGGGGGVNVRYMCEIKDCRFFSRGDTLAVSSITTASLSQVA